MANKSMFGNIGSLLKKEGLEEEEASFFEGLQVGPMPQRGGRIPAPVFFEGLQLPGPTGLPGAAPLPRPDSGVFSGTQIDPVRVGQGGADLGLPKVSPGGIPQPGLEGPGFFGKLLQGFGGPQGLANIAGESLGAGPDLGSDIPLAPRTPLMQDIGPLGFARDRRRLPIPSFQQGGVVEETGPAFLHRGETVLPANQPGGYGGQGLSGGFPYPASDPYPIYGPGSGEDPWPNWGNRDFWNDLLWRLAIGTSNVYSEPGNGGGLPGIPPLPGGRDEEADHCIDPETGKSVPCDNENAVSLPVYQQGGVVRETGPAIVHKGEVVIPKPPAELWWHPEYAKTEREIEALIQEGMEPELAKSLVERANIQFPDRPRTRGRGRYEGQFVEPPPAGSEPYDPTMPGGYPPGLAPQQIQPQGIVPGPGRITSETLPGASADVLRLLSGDVLSQDVGYRPPPTPPTPPPSIAGLAGGIGQLPLNQRGGIPPFLGTAPSPAQLSMAPALGSLPVTAPPSTDIAAGLSSVPPPQMGNILSERVPNTPLQALDALVPPPPTGDIPPEVLEAEQDLQSRKLETGIPGVPPSRGLVPDESVTVRGEFEREPYRGPIDTLGEGGVAEGEVGAGIEEVIGPSKLPFEKQGRLGSILKGLAKAFGDPEVRDFAGAALVGLIGGGGKKGVRNMAAYNQAMATGREAKAARAEAARAEEESAREERRVGFEADRVKLEERRTKAIEDENVRAERTYSAELVELIATNNPYADFAEISAENQHLFETLGKTAETIFNAHAATAFRKRRIEDLAFLSDQLKVTEQSVSSLASLFLENPDAVVPAEFAYLIPEEVVKAARERAKFLKGSRKRITDKEEADILKILSDGMKARTMKVGVGEKVIELQSDEEYLKDRHSKAKVIAYGRTPELTGVGGQTPAAISLTMSLKNDFWKETKDFNEISRSYEKISALARSGVATDKPSDDVALVFSFMKVLDPTSVVRETEYASAAQAGAVPDKVLSLYKRLMLGETLTAEQRIAFSNTARKVYNSAWRQFDITRQQYEKNIDDFGLAPVSKRTIIWTPEGETRPGSPGYKNWQGRLSAQAARQLQGRDPVTGDAPPELAELPFELTKASIMEFLIREGIFDAKENLVDQGIEF